jgi:hypothetical protein
MAMIEMKRVQAMRGTPGSGPCFSGGSIDMPFLDRKRAAPPRNEKIPTGRRAMGLMSFIGRIL